MHGYQEFPIDVSSAVKVFLNDFEYIKTEESSSSVVYELPKCKLILSIEGENIDGYFLEKDTTFVDNKFYGLRNILDYYNVKYESIDYEHSLSIREKANLGIRTMLKLMTQYCSHILKDGDFAWVPDFNNFLDKRARKRWGI